MAYLVEGKRYILLFFTHILFAFRVIDQCFSLHFEVFTLCLMNMNYAIIGDVHGMLEPLERLLTKLGFTYQQGVYQHNAYKAVFLGDLVDRGKHQRGVLELVRKMVDAGHAYAVMGNHEHNTVGYYWRHPKTNKYLVPHKAFRNKMHAAVLNDYPEKGEDTQEIMAWMSRLPVYLELDGFRAVHACWHDVSVDALQPFLNEQNQFHSEAFIESFDCSTPVYQPLSRLIRGATMKVPGIVDDFGNVHKNVRVQWWRNEYQSWDELLTRESDVRQARGMPLPEGYLDDLYYAEDSPPVFFGHYWFNGNPGHLTSNLACMDYSACVGGQLVAYDWRVAEEPASKGLRQDRFVSVDSHSFRD
ncbi:MAG: Metallophosphoesterase [uncultured Thiotrichaceae bacterium]|uniref:Metallophosphoesterase n=1 Tax=uncultured Thiotrichaceae bacterium TaxID=298394 RepID=A0A6S6T7H4_9GAMM|nr:MAG: Metallophosphoesterase [uncultured Thiotrichaceae bacterium]